MTLAWCCLFLSCLVLAPYAGAQDSTVRWSAELRVRGEMDGRDFRSASPPNFYSLLRVRLGMDLRPADNVRIFLQAQDSRVMGEETAAGKFSTITNTRNLDLHQGFLELNRVIFEDLSVQLGRMELAYGTERLVGAVGWNNIGRSFDGVRLSGRFPNATVALFVMNTGESQIPPGAATPSAVESVRDTGQLFAGVYLKIRSFEQLAVDIYGLHENTRSQRVPGFNDLTRTTLGTCVNGTIGDVVLTGEAAWQFGDASTASVSAYLLSFLAAAELGKSGVSGVAAGVDLLSGTPEGNPNVRTFDPAFHTGHKFYGFMDYFVSIPGNTRNRGLRDILGRVTVKPGGPVTVTLWGHLLALAEPWGGSRDLGGECDLVAALKYNDATSVELGVSGFVPGEVMCHWFGGADVSVWGYVGVTVRL